MSHYDDHKIKHIDYTQKVLRIQLWVEYDITSSVYSGDIK